MIWERLLVEDIQIEVGLPENKGRYPVFFIYAATEIGQQIESFLKRKDVILVSLTSSMENWQRNMSPWPAKALNKKTTDFTGEADHYIGKLQEKVLPKVEQYIEERDYTFINKMIVGYSMGGLFAVYLMTKNSYFQGAASISGSLWYDGFAEYMKKQQFPAEASWYFSVGNREAQTKNERMKQVQACTEMIAQLMNKQGQKVFYELNEGGHFQDVPLRIAKGIDSLSECLYKDWGEKRCR